MPERPQLIETSFKEAIAIIAAAPELPADKRQHWATSLRGLARALGKPPEVIPARYSAVRADLLNLHAVPAGMTPKTLQNHKSNAKSALLWLAKEKGIPEHGAPLLPAWAQLKAKIDEALIRWRLSALMRFCSAAGITPAAVDETAIDRLLAYRAAIGKSADAAFRRLLARAWNACGDDTPGWPRLRLSVPAAQSRIEVDWAEFPEGLRRDVDRYLDGLTRLRRSRNGQRIRPLKQTTIRTRRAELQAAARMAVKTGLPIESLTSMAALLSPDVAEKVIDAYWQKNGETPAAFTIDLAGRFVAIARETKCLNEAQGERLEEMAYELDTHRDHGLTEKNLALIRQVYSPGVWARVLELPRLLLIEAYRQRAHSPVRAAVTAQLAAAIIILTVAPIRLANLTAIRIDTNLIKPGGVDSNYWLQFPNYDVKNRVKLDFPLDDERTEIITKYIHDFRPTLLRGRNEDWLFPGQRHGAKQKVSFSGQITERIYDATGLRITVHQFRHAAGAIILKHRPGEYELVRQLLGHRNVQTTVRAYVGLEGIQASEIFGRLVAEEVRKNSERAASWKSGGSRHA
jgi:integrase